MSSLSKFLPIKDTLPFSNPIVREIDIIINVWTSDMHAFPKEIQTLVTKYTSVCDTHVMMKKLKEFAKEKKKLRHIYYQIIKSMNDNPLFIKCQECFEEERNIIPSPTF